MRENLTEFLIETETDLSMSKRPRDYNSDDDETAQETLYTSGIQCYIPPCHLKPIEFTDYLSYEAHIISTHNHICSECNKRFPSDAFLNIHIDENHNPFFQINKEKGEKIFKCLQYSLTGCKKTCIDRRKRRLHMIDKHGYPRDFNFGIVDSGLQNDKISLLK